MDTKSKMKNLQLVFVAAVCFFAITNKANAQFSGGSGTENDPYIITTAAQLVQFSTYFNEYWPPDEYYQYHDKCYKLGNDIDLSAYGSGWNGGKGWIPIGSYTYYNSFEGSFDGNNKKITGLYINESSYQGFGFFGYIAGGKVFNLGIENANVTGYDYVGAVVGRMSGGAITNCYSTGKVRANRYSAGGIAGDCSGSITITNCNSMCEVTGGDSYTGGIVGESIGGSISNCYFTGKVSGKNWAGGIAGLIKELCNISNCYSTDEITGIELIAGIAGYVYDNCTIVNCYSTGKINGNSAIGGIAGSLMSGSTVSNCYATSNVNGNSDVGGIAGRLSGSYIKNCYSTGEVSANAGSGGVAGIVNNAGTLSFSVALNPSVTGMTIESGRVAGNKSILSGLFNNVAYNGIKNIYGNTTWEYKGLNNFDGEDMSAQTIKSDGTLGGRFSAANGWTIQNGKLPGLFGQAVDMPAHLSGVGIASTTLSDPIRVYPNPANEQLTINNEQLIINNVEIFDVVGRPVVGSNLCVRPATTIDISNLPSGVYFVKIYTENGMITQKIIKN